MKNKIISFVSAVVMAGSCLFTSPALSAELGGVDIHGFISQGFIMSDTYNYLTHNSKDGSFDYNEVGINFGKDLTDNLRVGMQFFSRDLGDVANNKVTIDWAYGDYRLKDWFGIRAGRIKLPIGLYNETRDIDMLRTGIVMPQSLYNDLIRDTAIAANGAGLYGNIDLSKAGSLDYQAISGVINPDNESGVKKYFDDSFAPELSLNGEMDTDIAYVGSLRWNTPLDGLLFGVSYLTMESENPVLVGGAISTTQEFSTDILTLSVEYTWEDLVVAAEYQTFEVESYLPSLDVRSPNTSEGYYLSASYRFTELFSLGAHYSVYYADEDDKDGNKELTTKSDAWEKDLALSLRFDINEYMIFKVEGHSVDGTARVVNADNPTKNEDDFYYGVAKVTFSF